MSDERGERLARARRSLWRTALIWTPLTVAAGGGGLYFLITQLAGTGSGWVIPPLLLVFGALFSFQSVQAIRDLRGEPITTSGFITRHWWRFDLLARTNYLRLDHAGIFRTDRVQWQLVKQGDYVAIEFFPASMVAVSVEKTEAPEGVEPPSGEQGGPPPPPPGHEPDPLLIERD